MFYNMHVTHENGVPMAYIMFLRMTIEVKVKNLNECLEKKSNITLSYACACDT